LILGDLNNDIRRYSYAHRPDSRPNHVIDGTRQHLYYANASDDGLGHGDFLRIRLSGLDPQVIGPQSLWDAADVPTLYIKAAITAAQEQCAAEIFFADAASSFSADRRVRFPVIADGQVRTYQIDLSAHPLYTDAIGRFRFDPMDAGDDAATMDLYYISYALVDARGDLNGDGNVNGLDVSPFVDVLVGGPLDVVADMNGDGEVNGLDTGLFVAAVVGRGGGATGVAIPEPPARALAAVGLLGLIACARRYGGASRQPLRLLLSTSRHDRHRPFLEENARVSWWRPQASSR